MLQLLKIIFGVNDISILSLQVVKNVDGVVLKNWWSELSTERLHYLCEVLRITLSTFQYKVRLGAQRESRAGQEGDDGSRGNVGRRSHLMCIN